MFITRTAIKYIGTDPSKIIKTLAIISNWSNSDQVDAVDSDISLKVSLLNTGGTPIIEKTLQNDRMTALFDLRDNLLIADRIEVSYTCR